MHANWQAIFAGRFDLIRVDDGDTTWSEWWSGKRVDGQDFQVRGVTLFEVKNGQITAGRLYVEDVERAGRHSGESLSGRRPNLSGRTPA
jgi:ketosteroid isomerase-like protein